MRHHTLACTVQLPVNAAQSKLRQTLAAEGFETIGHLAWVDGSDGGACRLLVAYSPRLTRLALATHNHIDAALPITVLITTNGSSSTLEVLDPMTMTDLAANPALLAIRIDARSRIERALAGLEPAADLKPVGAPKMRAWAANQQPSPHREKEKTPT